MTREEPLAALLVERYTSPWWVTKPDAPPDAPADDDLACARRLKVLDAVEEGAA